MFKKLTNVNNSYSINSIKKFTANKVEKTIINEVFDFAYGMTFGKAGEHRPCRSGGQINRKNGELFANTFQGKLAEFCVYHFLQHAQIELEKPDLSTWKLGKWDGTDLQVGDIKINIKSAAFFSNLLLLETQDWNSEAKYRPNNLEYDYHVLCRIKPDIKDIMSKERLLYSNAIELLRLKTLVTAQQFNFDIPGFITHAELKYLIEKNFVLPQNSLLNGKTKMDSENFYCQLGGMKNIASLPNLLRKIQHDP